MPNLMFTQLRIRFSTFHFDLSWQWVGIDTESAFDTFICTYTVNIKRHASLKAR